MLGAGDAAIEGGINGAAQAGLIASGAGIPAALLVDFLAGTTGSAAKQYFVDGKVDVKESIKKGFINAIGQLPHNDKLFDKLGKLGKLQGLGREATKGAMSGAGEAGARYLFDHIGSDPAQVRMGTGVLPAVNRNFLPDGLLTDPKRGCGSESPFPLRLGYHSKKGYQYDGVPRISESRSNKASLGGFLKETALGGLMGGLSSAAFYKLDKGLDKLIDSVRPRKRIDNRINPNDIRYSQSSVNGAREIIDSMKTKGWDGKPIDVVRMSDGNLTTIDNTRVLAAHYAEIDVQAIVHDFNEVLPDNLELIERFTTSKGTPKTWGDAVLLRIGKQNSGYRNAYPLGSDIIGWSGN